MRELKFRVWSESEQKYLYGLSRYLFGSDDNEKCTLYIPQDFKAVFEQYTGLKDKNGQKIFEGDIVKYDDGDAYGVCSFNGCFGIKNRNLSVLYSSYTFNDNDLYSSTGKLRLEVIGNIHENPEILEAKNEI